MRKAVQAALGLSLAAGAVIASAAAADSATVSRHTFRKIQLTDKFWAEGATVADINGDGHPDIISGPYWYEGPDFTKRHEIFPAKTTFVRTRPDGSKETVPGYEGALGTENAYSDSFFDYAADFNHDGRIDVLRINLPGFEAVWYENPGPQMAGHEQPWKEHRICDDLGDESPVLVDLFRDGHPVLLGTVVDSFGFLAPEPDHPERPWIFHAISKPQPMLTMLRQKVMGGKPFPFTHGLGYGDVLGNGHLDVLAGDGWWEQPAAGGRDSVWKFHRWTFLKPRPAGIEQRLLAPDFSPKEELPAINPYFRWPYSMVCAQMHVADVNGDGRPDIITGLDAHGYGLAWCERLPGNDSAGEPLFQAHVFMNKLPSENRYGLEFTEAHAIGVANLDGENAAEIITGKRFWAHGPKGPDPETDGPAVLYWFKPERLPSGAIDYVPHLIDSDSGVGTQLTIADVNSDGQPDIVIGNKKGLFVFIQESRPASRQELQKARPPVLFPGP